MIQAQRSVDSMGGFGGRVIDLRSRRRPVPPLELDWDMFGFKMLPGNTITIRKRTIRIHQEANVKIAEREVPLGGSTCWIYASITRATFALAGVMTAAVEPMSDEGSLNVPLYCFTLNATTGVYELDDPTKFDVNMGE